MNLLEIEIKARIKSPDEIRGLILKEGGIFSEIENHEDIYFNHPSRDFAETDEAFRIRTVNTETFITYKGPKIGTAAKSRIEREVSVGDNETMRDIIVFLGFKESGRVVKRREVYTCGGLTLCIDRVDLLGDFIEIEKIGDDRASIEAEVLSFAAKLGINEFERRSYLEMVLS